MVSLTQLSALILLIFFVTLILFFSNRTRQGRVPALRPIAAFSTLKGLMAQAIESGRKLHISLGTGGITQNAPADTLAGLTALEYLSRQAAASKTTPIITTADPAVMLLAQNTMRKAYGPDKEGAVKSAAQVRWISPEKAAYAAGVMGVLSIEDIAGNVMIGNYGDEYLLMGEAAQQQAKPITTVAAAAGPDVLPFLFATTSHALWGEEMYAAGAYLDRKPTHIGSLLAQDTVRWGLGIFILISVLLKAFGVLP